MIVFDLRCGNGHVFEAWFGSTADYEDQRARDFITCPFCGDLEIGKAVMAPAVAAKSNRRADRPQPVATADPEKVKAMMAAMAALQIEVETSCDYVGDRFSDEARAIHHGETDSRGIYGEATPEQAQALHEEGIEILPLPFRSRRAADA